MRWLFVLLLFPSLVLAQSGPSKRAWKNYTDGDYEKALELSVKALEKDTLDALAWFVSSHLNFNPNYREVDIRLADEYLRRARTVFRSASPDQQSDYADEGLSTNSMDALRVSIDSAAFSVASSVMTEEAFIEFLEDFPGARDSTNAVALRDSLAFHRAVAVNTYQAYNNFMEKYPGARQVPEARARYEKLYFDIATEDRRLESYEQFLADNPATPYRYEAEHRIFQILTAGNHISAYRDFLRRYPESRVRQKALNYLYYLYRDADSLQYFPAEWRTDSLSQIIQKGQIWYPFIEEGQFGFMDETGRVTVPASVQEMNPEYLCSGARSDVIILPDGRILNRNMQVIYRHENDRVTELSMGLLKLENDRQVSVLHKAGYPLIHNLSDAQIVGRLLKTGRRGKWGLASFTGQEILPARFEEIDFEQGLYFLDTGEGWQILTPEEIHFLANNMIKGITSPVYDQYEFVGRDRLWLRQGTTESLVDHRLEPIIPPAKQRILVLPSVYVARGDEDVRILSHDQMQRYRTGDRLLNHNDRWLILQKSQGMGLYSLENFRLSTLSDSVRLLGDAYAITFFEGNRKLHTLGADPILLSSGVRASLIQAEEREWVLLADRGRKTVINRYGQQIYTGPVDKVTPLTDSLLVLERYGKKELLTLRGEKPLQVRFDGIGSPEDNLIPLLAGQRFGAYDKLKDLFVRPVSTKKIRRYNHRYYIAEMDKFGLIDEDSRMVVSFEFDEIRHWNDTTCLVRQGSGWSFYHIGTGLILEEPIRSIQMVQDSNAEHEMIIFRNGAFGVINNRKGEIVPPTLDDILNVGTPGSPLYFTDKFVDEANLHVVVYFDRDGNIIRKQALEEEAFDRVYCD